MIKRPQLLRFLLLAATIAWPGTARAQAPGAHPFKVARFSIGGDGGTDYLTAEPGTGRVFVSRSTHVMVVDGATGKVLGDIPDTPRIARHRARAEVRITASPPTAATRRSTMFDLKTLAVIQKIPIPTGGLDGIMYDDFSDRIILTNHSRPIGTAVAIDAEERRDRRATAQLEDNAPEGAASDGKGRIFVNNEGKNTIQVLDAKTMKVLASWPIAPCDGPTGIAYDRARRTGSSRAAARRRWWSIATTGKVVATIANGDGVDALGWDPVAEADLHSRRPRRQRHGGAPGLARQVHASWRRCRRCAGAKTIAVDPVTHVAYLFQPEYGPAPAPAPGSRAARGGMPRPARAGDRHLVLRDQPLTSSKEPAMSGVRVLVGTRKGAFILTSDGKREEVGRQRAALRRAGRCTTSRDRRWIRTGSTRRSPAAGSGS